MTPRKGDGSRTGREFRPSADGLLERRVVPSAFNVVRVSGSAEVPRISSARGRNLQPYAPAAEAIYNNRLPAYVSRGAKKANLEAIEAALQKAHVPTSGAIHVTTEPINNYDDGVGTEITWGLRVGRRGPYAVQVIVSPSGIITSTYAGQTDPDQTVLFPPPQPVTEARLQSDLDLDFQEGGLTFGPVNEAAFMNDLYRGLSQLGLPSDSSNIITNLGGTFSGDGGEVEILIGFQISYSGFWPNTVFWAGAVLKDDGTYQLQVSQNPVFLSVPDPIPVNDPGDLSSVFRA
jgi:hypothetical protein